MIKHKIRSSAGNSGGAFLGYTLEILRKEPVPEVARAIQRTTQVLGQIRDYCAVHQVPFVLCSFPRSYQIYQEEFVRRLKQSSVAPDDFSANALGERIKLACDQLGVHHVGVKARFDQAREAGIELDKLFIQNDGHWNRQGHRLAAEAILPELMGVIGKH